MSANRSCFSGYGNQHPVFLIFRTENVGDAQWFFIFFPNPLPNQWNYRSWSKKPMFVIRESMGFCITMLCIQTEYPYYVQAAQLMSKMTNSEWKETAVDNESTAIEPEIRPPRSVWYNEHLICFTLGFLLTLDLFLQTWTWSQSNTPFQKWTI